VEIVFIQPFSQPPKPGIELDSVSLCERSAHYSQFQKVKTTALLHIAG